MYLLYNLFCILYNLEKEIEISIVKLFSNKFEIDFNISNIL